MFFSNTANVLYDFFIILSESEGIIHDVIGVWLSGWGECAGHRRWGVLSIAGDRQVV